MLGIFCDTVGDGADDNDEVLGGVHKIKCSDTGGGDEAKGEGGF